MTAARAMGAAGADAVSSVLRPAGPEAGTLADLMLLTLVVCAVLFLFAMACLCAALWWRGRRALPDGWWLWGGGVILPVVIFGALLWHSFSRSEGLDDPPPPGALVVNVTGHMWWWSLRYEADDGQPAFASANELRVPVGRPVRLTLASADVIHSVWVPPLGGKMDMVPGRLNRLTFTADRPGVYRGPCAEFCGTQHARMFLHVVAMPADEFEAWRRRQTSEAPRAIMSAAAGEGASNRLAAAPATPATPQERAGRGAWLFGERGCAACHQVRGRHESAREGLGPDLSDLAGRGWLGAGALRHTPDELRAWISDPQASKPGARMPSYRHLPEAEIDALATYLEGSR